MRICIVTVYNSENCGSYLQAFSLGKIIEALGHQSVYYLRKRKTSPPNYLTFVRQIIRLILRKKKSSIPLRIYSYFNFRRSEKYFNTVKESETDTCDAFFIGSDTLWNLDVKYFLENRDIYWGKTFKGKPVFSYAVSASNTSSETFTNDVYYKENIDNFMVLSVRDERTAKIISQITSKELELVCDPTMLIDKEVYDTLAEEIPNRRYLLLYIFEDSILSENFINQVQQYANDNSLEIVSFGVQRPWCTHSVSYSPGKFISYFKCAQYIITNTFHGTVFSIIYNKCFVALAAEKNKVTEVMEQFKLTSRLIKQTDCLKSVLMQPIDYCVVNLLVLKERNKGMAYIKRCLDEVKNEGICR